MLATGDSDQERSTAVKIGGFLLGAAFLAVAIIVTVGYFPDRVAFVFDNVTVDGTVVGDRTSRSCGESTCYYAQVQYTIESGTTYVRKLKVANDARPGDSIQVRYRSDDPTVSTTDSTFKAIWLLVFATAIGPLVILSILGGAAKTIWRWVRAVGEAD